MGKKHQQDDLELNTDASAHKASATDEFSGNSAEPAPEPIDADTLQADLDATRADAEEHKNRCYQLSAHISDLTAQVKRADRQIAEARDYGLRKFITDVVVPMIDNLENALAVCEQDEDAHQATKDGLQMAHKAFMDSLTKHGLEILDPVGEKMDPNFHEAMTTQISDEHDKNTILQVVQKGYVLKDRVIRPARVMVSKPSDNE